MTSYGSWKLADLKTELGRRKVKKSGKKADLVKRLEFYDRNTEVTNDEPMEGDYTVETPSRALYRDFNSDTDFPRVTLDSVDGFLAPFGVTLGEKIKRLYTERFLYFVRSATEGEKFFVLANCGAEMKKRVSYLVDVVFDKEGAVLEAQCDCEAGTGPDAHCKHVQCILFALVSFSECRTIISKETCTQRLQTFHQCKSYKGSPLKASQLTVRSSGQGRDLKNLVDYDPRPRSMVKRDGYTAFFSNLCVSYQANHISSNSLPMPILQTIPPANIYAIANDHDYLKDHPEDQFLEAVGLRHITSEQVAQIERETRGQSKAKRWLKERCMRLTSSNFGRICKCTDRTDKKKLARSFVVQKKIDCAPIRHGCKYEHVAVENYEKLRSVRTSPCGTFVSAAYPFISSTPDRVIDENTVLEVKCPYVSREKEISTVTVPYLKEKDNELYLDPNHDYYYQVQGQLFCSDRKQCYFVVYTFKDTKVVSVPRNELFIKSMVDKLCSFYDDYFRHAVLDHLYYKRTDQYSFDY